MGIHFRRRKFASLRANFSFKSKTHSLRVLWLKKANRKSQMLSLYVKMVEIMNILINLNVRICDGVCVHYCVLSPFSQL